MAFSKDFLWGGATAANQFEGAGTKVVKDYLLMMLLQMEHIHHLD